MVVRGGCAPDRSRLGPDGRGGDLRGEGDGRVPGVVVRVVGPGEHGDDQRLAARGPRGGDVVDLTGVTAAGLAPTSQPGGRPARTALSPVVLALRELTSRSRPDLPGSAPSARDRRSAAIRDGVVVSRSPDAAFTIGSVRSSRVTGSPRARTNRVTPRGPPARPVSRLAAVLSLTSTAARHSAATVMPSSTCWEVTGAYSSTSARPSRTSRSSSSGCCCARCSTAAVETGCRAHQEALVAPVAEPAGDGSPTRGAVLGEPDPAGGRQPPRAVVSSGGVPRRRARTR